MLSVKEWGQCNPLVIYQNTYGVSAESMAEAAGITKAAMKKYVIGVRYPQKKNMDKLMTFGITEQQFTAWYNLKPMELTYEPETDE